MKRTNLLVIFLLIATAVSAQQLLVPSQFATIQEAINSAEGGDTVLVADGTYIENINFLGKPITVASHFILDADESHIANTIIDGSQSANPDTASTVLMISGENDSSCLAGFTITGGTGTYATEYVPEFGGVSEVKAGGGILIIDGGGTIMNNLIMNNSVTTTIEDDTTSNGAGIGIIITDECITDMLSVIIKNNTIKSNQATGSPCVGAGIYVSIDRSDQEISMDVIIRENLITENRIYSDYTNAHNYSAGIGMGFDMPIREGNYIIQDNEITKNVMEHPSGNQWAGGGGIYLWYLGTEDNDVIAPWIVNNVIAENVSPAYGGGVSLYYFDAHKSHNLRPAIINNTIVNNTGSRGGAGLHFSDATPLLLNNILWNEIGGSVKEIIQFNNCNILAKYNSIQGGFDLDWNVMLEPGFVEDSYELSESSLCIGRGADSVEVVQTWYMAPEFDMLGNERKNSERIDLGAIESTFAQVDYFEIAQINVKDATDECDGVATVTVSGGIPPYRYFLDDVKDNNNIFSDLCPKEEYIAKVLDADDNETSLSFGVTDIEINNTLSTLSVYPNPADNLLTVEAEIPGIYTIEIHTMNGQRLYNSDMTANMKHIDISGFSKGVYFLTVRSNTWNRTEKIVKF